MCRSVLHRSFFLVILFTLVHRSPAQRADEEYSFIVASDHREHATEPFRSREYTLGGFEAIRQVGKGSLLSI